MEVVELLLAHFGPRHWWPANSPFEVAVGAILVKSGAWENTASAVRNLEDAVCLDPQRLDALSEEELARLIVPSPYLRQKAKKLKAFDRVLVEEHGGDLAGMLSGTTG